MVLPCSQLHAFCYYILAVVVLVFSSSWLDRNCRSGIDRIVYRWQVQVIKNSQIRLFFMDIYAGMVKMALRKAVQISKQVDHVVGNAQDLIICIYVHRSTSVLLG